MIEAEAASVKTLAVLAGAYRGSDPRAFLTHASADGETTLCRRVKPGNLADEYASDPDEAPSCPICRKRDPREKDLA